MLKSGKNPSKILLTEKWLRKNQNLSKKFDESLINIVSEEVLASAISTINPDGIAALVEISAIPENLFNGAISLIKIARKANKRTPEEWPKPHEKLFLRAF
ncbi:hypothetical protein OA510_02770 [Prochlorococcus sp. AH-716-I17]|nr:hypothetical protein [Prochlorococcus sp. AH-716-I17]